MKRGGPSGPPFSFALLGSLRCHKTFQITRVEELFQVFARSLGIMPKYRFITPERVGKWYSDISLAKQFANTIGAGFYDRRTGKFVAYPGTKLEVTL